MILVHCNQMLSLAILGIDSLTKNPKYPRQVGQSLSNQNRPTTHSGTHATWKITGLSSWHITMATSPPSTVLGLVAPARSCPLSSESCPNMRMGMLPGMWPTRFASQNRSAQPPRKQRRAKWLRAGPTAKVPHVTAWLHGGQEWLWLMTAINNSCCINKILYIVLREAACLYLQPDGLVATSCNMFTLVFVRGANIDKHGPLHFDAVTSRPCSQRQNNILYDAALMHYMGHLDCVWTAT